MWTGPRHSLNTMPPLAEQEQHRDGKPSFTRWHVACVSGTKFYQGRTDLKPQHLMTRRPGQPIGQTEIAAAEMGKRRVRRYYRAEHLVLTTDAGEQSKVLVGRQKSRSVDGVELAGCYVRCRMTYVGLAAKRCGPMRGLGLGWLDHHSLEWQNPSVHVVGQSISRGTALSLSQSTLHSKSCVGASLVGVLTSLVGWW